MFKKILLSIMTFVLVMSTINFVSAQDYQCGEIWSKYNYHQSVSREEFNSCKSIIIKYYRTELYLEYQVYKEDKNYCYNKWVETYMRREPTRIEERLCGNQLEQYTQEYMTRKRSVVRY